MTFTVSVLLTGLVAFTVMMLWNWFIAPLGVVEITILHAFGINLFVSLLTTQITPEMLDRSKAERLMMYLASAVFSFTALVLGFLVQAFM